MNSFAEWRPQEMPTLLVNRLSRLISKKTDEELGVVGLTASQLPVLASLKDGMKLTQKELAELTGVSQPSMAQLLARMERDELVQRTPSPSDGRISMVSLTATANMKLEPGRSALRRVDDNACSILTERERAMLATILLKLLRHAEGER